MITLRNSFRRTTSVLLILASYGLNVGCTKAPTKVAASEGEPGLTRDVDAASDAPFSESDGEGEMADAGQIEEASRPDEVEGNVTRSSLPLPEGTKVLHIGDSFAGALGLPLGALFEEARVRSVLKHTDASYLTDWAWDGNLQKYIWKYNPDLVIITLGANELAITEPAMRKKTVEKIVSLVGDRPCLWIAIPLWNNTHNGLMDTIEASVSPCVYWDSNKLMDPTQMPRISDGIHPTKEARKDWAKQVFEWLSFHRQPQEGRVWALAP